MTPDQIDIICAIAMPIMLVLVAYLLIRYNESEQAR